MTTFKEGAQIANHFFSKIAGLEATRVELGYGSFVTMHFGKDRTLKETIKGKESTRVVGEWYLWVYMCAWRIDLSGQPFVGANDDRDLIKTKLKELEGKKLLHASVLNPAFDVLLSFDGGLEMRLFSYEVVENRQWMLFTPEQKIFRAGPGSNWLLSASESETFPNS